MFYSLTDAGSHKHKNGVRTFSFDIHNSKGQFCGMIIDKPAGWVKFATNSTATKASARKFPSRAAALEFMHQRRVKKGWATA